MNTATMNMSAMNDVESILKNSSAAPVKAAKKPMTAWGATWRIGGILVLFVAALIATILGANFAIGWVATLGLSAVMTTALTIALQIAAGAMGGVIGYVAGTNMVKVARARTAAKLAEGAAKAAA